MRRSPASPDERAGDVERVRDLLRDRGYLSTPLERYVIAVPRGRSFAAWDLEVATKVGLLAGIAFSILLGLQAVATNPELASRPRDLLVWMGYLLLLTAPPLALADAALGLLMRLVTVRRPERFARGAGLAMGAVLLFLLLLSWMSDPVPPTGSAQVVAALVLLACLAALVARLLSISVIAFSLRLGALPEAPRRAGRWPALAWVVITAAALASAWVASGAHEAASAAVRSASPFTVFPPPHGVDLIALDGISSDELAALPALVAVAAEVYRAELLPPSEGWENTGALWTTIVTGLPASRHGVRSLGIRDVAFISTPLRDAPGALGTASRVLSRLRLARPRPMTSTVRKTKALWEILAEKSRPVAAVNFWGTSPAPLLPAGAVVSEAAFFAALRGEPLKAEVTPAAAAAAVSGVLPRVPELTPEERLVLGCEGSSDRLCRAVRTDPFHWEALQAITAADPALQTGSRMLYLPGRDIARFIARTRGLELPDATADRRLGDLVGRILQRRRDATVLLVATPGRGVAPDRKGMVLLLGRSIRPGRAPEPATVLDVAPTFLYLAGFPCSDELPGRVLSDAADDGFRRTYPLKRIETFGDRAVAAGTAAASAPDTYELLRSLGYLP